MTVKEIRHLTGLTQEEFSKRYKIPKRSIGNWETEVRKCPEYVLELLEFKVKYDLKNTTSQ